MRPHPVWIHAKEIVRWKKLSHDWPLRALVCRIDDPALAPLLTLPPTPWDISDSQKPLAGPREHFLHRRALLRKLVALWIQCAPEDVVITHDAQGAPRVVAPDAGVFVSVSARREYTALAVGNVPVGVDIEPSGPSREPVWEVLHPSERAPIEAEWQSQGDQRFIEVWMAKEAYLKALGTGLKRDPASVAINFGSYPNFEVRDAARPVAKMLGLHDCTFIDEKLVNCACIALL